MTHTLTRRSIIRGLAGGTAALLAGPVLGAGPASGTGSVPAAFTLRPTPGIARLSANENPYGPSPKALAAAAEAAARGAYYPGPIEEELLSLIGARHGLSLEHLVLSSGSNEALCAAMAAYGSQGRILAPGLTYDPHLNYARRIGVEVQRVPLQSDMSIDLPAMAAAAEADGVSLVYLCNPNNPTGMTLDPDVLRAFCRSVGRKTTVLIDEAYNELTDDPDRYSMVDLVRGEENVIVMRTFSKLFALAGLRIGYVMAPVKQAELVRAHVMSWPNVVGLAAAITSYEDQTFQTFSRQKIQQGREMLTDIFKQHGVNVLPSQANFVYADIGRDATEFAARMLERGVQIRGIYQPYTTYSRVSTGRLEDIETFGRVFHDLYGKG